MKKLNPINREAVVLEHMTKKLEFVSDNFKDDEAKMAYWMQQYTALVDQLVWYLNKGYTLEDFVSEWFMNDEQ